MYELFSPDISQDGTVKGLNEALCTVAVFIVRHFKRTPAVLLTRQREAAVDHRRRDGILPSCANRFVTVCPGRCLRAVGGLLSSSLPVVSESQRHLFLLKRPQGSRLRRKFTH